MATLPHVKCMLLSNELSIGTHISPAKKTKMHMTAAAHNIKVLASDHLLLSSLG